MFTYCSLHHQNDCGKVADTYDCQYHEGEDFEKPGWHKRGECQACKGKNDEKEGGDQGGIHLQACKQLALKEQDKGPLESAYGAWDAKENLRVAGEKNMFQ